MFDVDVLLFTHQPPARIEVIGEEVDHLCSLFFVALEILRCENCSNQMTWLCWMEFVDVLAPSKGHHARNALDALHRFLCEMSPARSPAIRLRIG